MYRSDLARVFEICDLVCTRGRSILYFENFENSLIHQVKRKQFMHIETELGKLDSVAWAILREKVVPLFETRRQSRGWQPAFDILNEAKAYNYLSAIGCTDVSFVPVSKVRGEKTPDLEAKLAAQQVLCEVKTINPSDEEAHRRADVTRGKFVVSNTQARLPNAFFEKLAKTFGTAETQMTTYFPEEASRRIIYVILNFDDGLNQYVEDYLGQVHEFMRSSPLPEAEVVFDVKPAFYSATSESAASRLLKYQSTQRRK